MAQDLNRAGRILHRARLRERHGHERIDRYKCDHHARANEFAEPAAHFAPSAYRENFDACASRTARRRGGSNTSSQISALLPLPGSMCNVVTAQRKADIGDEAMGGQGNGSGKVGPVLGKLSAAAATLGAFIAVGQAGSQWIKGMSDAELATIKAKQEIEIQAAQATATMAEECLKMVISKEVTTPDKLMSLGALSQLDSILFRNGLAIDTNRWMLNPKRLWWLAKKRGGAESRARSGCTAAFRRPGH